MNEYVVLYVAIILISGFVAGVLCKYLKASPLIGYLLVGALIGPGCLDLTNVRTYEQIVSSASLHRNQPNKPDETSATPPENASVNHADDPWQTEVASYSDTTSLTQENEELRRELALKNEELANHATLVPSSFEEESKKTRSKIEESHNALEGITELGVLLLLFSIGIEFTFAQLTATAKYMFVGGTIQMGVTIGLSILICIFFKLGWVAGLALGSVVALSSTALVYKSLGDLGQADTKRAKATLGLLIFQDVALVPLLLILPIVLHSGEQPSDNASFWFGNPWIDMALKSLAFCLIVLLLKFASRATIIPRLAALRSNDIVILYAAVVLMGMCVVAHALGLTEALGALAAGVILGENRLTHQIDALVLPFREAFSAMFFISLGMLTDFSYVFHHPLVCFLALLGAIVFKAACATLALRVCGMDKRGALAYGVSISQIGELAFMLLGVGYAAKAFDEQTYNTMLFVSVASLVLTPNMVKLAMTKFGMPPEAAEVSKADELVSPELIRAIGNSKGHAIIIGAGPIGQGLANALIAAQRSVCVVDFNPVNLQPFRQNNVATVTGDGADYEILRQAGIGHAELVFVTTPRDDLTLGVVRAVRALKPTAAIAARTRYRVNVAPLERAGARIVLCEENAIAEDMLKLINDHLNPGSKAETATV